MGLFHNMQPERVTAWGAAISDLKIDQLLGISTEAIARHICYDFNEIQERQKLLRDCINNEDLMITFKQIRDNIKSINQLFEKGTAYSETFEKIFYEVRSFQVYMDSINALELLYVSKKGLLQSERLIHFLETFHTIYESKEYLEICLHVKERLKNIDNIKSVTVGINLNMALEPCDMGIVSINNYSFICPSYLQRKFSFAENDRYLLASLIKFESDNNLLERSLYLTINRILAKSLKQYNSIILQWFRKSCSAIMSSFEDIDFLCACVNFSTLLKEKGGFMCFPECSESIQIEAIYNPRLLHKKAFRDIVSNDMCWNFEGIHMFVLTGANSGGKSVFVESIGICQTLFQLGMIVPAQKAYMRPVGCVYVHFSTLMRLSEGESRFASECSKMREILENSRKNDMILMDETFSATSENEGAAVAYYVLKRIKKISCMCLFSTHIHGLIHYLPSINEDTKTVIPMHVECLNGIRTFRIVCGEHDESSHAYEIAQKYGLTFEDGD